MLQTAVFRTVILLKTSLPGLVPVMMEGSDSGLFLLFLYKYRDFSLQDLGFVHQDPRVALEELKQFECCCEQVCYKFHF